LSHRVFGAEASPYSVKVRSYLRYKGIPHEWLVRRGEAAEEYKKLARLPLIPLVACEDGRVLQDSTPILETFEAEHPEPSIHPEDATARFVSALLEEFGDEWGNKWMFHYRWAREVDQVACSRRLVGEMLGTDDLEQIDPMAKSIRERMVSRVWFVGSNEQTAPQIEQTFQQALDLLDPHLAERPWLFGGRPAFADFGLAAQIHNANDDPTCHGLIEARPNVAAWVARFADPEAEGDFEPWSALAPTLTPLLEQLVAGLFLPWSVANAQAIEEGAEEFTVELASGTWTQKPQKYHARSLKALRARYAEAAGHPGLDALLDATGCRVHLAG